MSANNQTPLVAICTYRVTSGKEEEFLDLLRRHWPTLNGLGLVENIPSQVFRGLDESGGTVFTEILTWKDKTMSDRAHEIPAVMTVWEPMGMCCEARLGRPPMEFFKVARLDLHNGAKG